MLTAKLLKDNKALLTYINSQPALLSYLYDIDLLPEQCLCDVKQYNFMKLVVIAFKIGKESK